MKQRFGLNPFQCIVLSTSAALFSGLRNSFFFLAKCVIRHDADQAPAAPNKIPNLYPFGIHRVQRSQNSMAFCLRYLNASWICAECETRDRRGMPARRKSHAKFGQQLLVSIKYTSEIFRAIAFCKFFPVYSWRAIVWKTHIFLDFQSCGLILVTTRDGEFRTFSVTFPETCELPYAAIIVKFYFKLYIA